MGTKKPVSATCYDETWIASAWGQGSIASEVLRDIEDPRPRVARAIELACIDQGTRLLDIACGRGEVPAIAARKGAFAVGIDFSSVSITYASEVRRGQGGCDKYGLLQADACNLPFADASFDRITMLDIVEHLLPEQLESMFSEVSRLLAPGGYAVIHTLPNRWVYDLTFPCLNRLSKRVPENPRGPIDSVVHVNEQDLPALSKMLDHCGLSGHVWLEQLMPAQARWNARDTRFGDQRDRLYPMLTGIWGSLLEIASQTPCKLLLSNDIYAVAWTGRQPELPTLPGNLTERLACRIFSTNRQRQ
ncbi:hypothetical protein B9N43_01615 [Denitratisoma sp. DHT3]|uniref:SAM-dependent methyltransferase n=1 Tax=Denitratisoma sp. DHT3 TaxID=1981880 RepID=UPI001198A04A|nr:class I SAM-dependent methyltransferase [Denitratisoma sp. DHT3]QDX80064.1 hypothetical protein B9N43_01615 [Denitratisoma sp. DHT3]